MIARHTDFVGEMGSMMLCDLCGKEIDEGYLVTPETDEEFEKIENVNPNERAFRDKYFESERESLILCEECIYNKFSKETTKMYSCKGERLRECENNLRGSEF